jgi:hypothetical protein
MWTKQPRTRSHVRRAYNRRGFTSKRPVCVLSPCGTCFERKTTSLGPVPICSRGIHGETTASHMGEGSKSVQHGQKEIGRFNTFTNGWYYFAGNKYNEMLACMHIVDEHRQFCQTVISRHVFRSRFISQWSSRKFGGG